MIETIIVFTISSTIFKCIEITCQEGFCPFMSNLTLNATYVMKKSIHISPCMAKMTQNHIYK